MSKFNSYARKIEEIAKADFAEYRKAEAALKEAEAKKRKYPEPSGIVNAEYAANAARAKADFIEAQANYNRVKKTFLSHNEEIAGIRKELVKEINSYYIADQSALNSNTIELMKSGILKPNEFTKLMNEALDAGNFTMCRIISKYASDAIEEADKSYGENSEQARELRLLSSMSNKFNGNEHLQAFDYLADVFRRASNNAGMIDHWDELTAETINEF